MTTGTRVALALGAVAALSGAYILGLTETSSVHEDVFFSFRYPKNWGALDGPVISDGDRVFLVIEDDTFAGKLLRMPDPHISLNARKTMPDMATAFERTIRGHDGRESVAATELPWPQWRRSQTYAATFFDPLDRVSGGKVILGDDVRIRLYLLQAPDGRICEVSYEVPASFLARRRADYLYGRLLQSLRLKPEA